MIWFLTRFNPLIPDTLTVACIVSTVIGYGFAVFLAWQIELAILFVILVFIIIVCFAGFAVYVDQKVLAKNNNKWAQVCNKN